MEPQRLHPDDLAAIAALLAAQNRPMLLTTEEAAAELRREAAWVRLNQVALGAVRMGDGPQGQLLFPREAIDAYLEARRVQAPHKPKPRRGNRRRAPVVDGPTLASAGAAVMAW